MTGVVKRFGSVTAVDGLDFTVPLGTCVGLLGPNGAGKSTTMRLIAGRARADEGEIRLLGYSLPQESKHARAQCGVVPQHDNLDTKLTARENLEIFAGLYGIPRKDRPRMVRDALSVVDLADRADSRAETLSGGMRRRLLIARAVVHRPALLLLDEPTTGLDPQVREELWVLLQALRYEGVTVLMSTHLIEEAERLADVVAVMLAGRIVVSGRPTEIISTYVGGIVAEFEGSPSTLEDVEAAARDRGHMTRKPGSSVIVMQADRLHGDIIARFGQPVVRPATLEDAFLSLVERHTA